MNRITLQECVSLFNSNELMKPAAVRNMEQLGEWETAAKYWDKIGRKLDADACRMILNATEKGDAYRESTKHLNDWVDKTVEEGIMSKDEALKKVFPEMTRLHKIFYP